MQAINWQNFYPLDAEIDELNNRLNKPLLTRRIRQILAEIILFSYPWQNRADLIPFYHPSNQHQKGQWIALLLIDPQGVRPTAWEVAKITQIVQAENPNQGSFQVLTLDCSGQKKIMASDIPNALYEFDLYSYNSSELAWLANWFADIYEKPIQGILDKLWKTGRLSGQYYGEVFIPAHISALESEQLLHFFQSLTIKNPWVSADEMVSSIPELSTLQYEIAKTILQASLLKCGYESIGSDRWTTSVLLEKLSREIPRGLPTPHVKSTLNIWTDQDIIDFEHVPHNAQWEDEFDEDNSSAKEKDQSLDGKWQSPNRPLRLPTLNYLHITQAYFPIDQLSTAFHPFAKIIFIQMIDGERLPFFLDRSQGMLKALDIEQFRTKFLESDLPAGTYLWLEHQGGENYRIAPRPLPSEIWVPCKQAYFEDGELQIFHTKIPMRYEGDPSVFKAEIRFEDIEALFAEAHRVNLSVSDAIIYSVVEICDGDPNNRAHRLDIFNAVYLKRMCSPNSVQVLLYTLPCFERLGGGYFRYSDQPSDKQEPRAVSSIAKKWTRRVTHQSKVIYQEAFSPNITTSDHHTESIHPQNTEYDSSETLQETQKDEISLSVVQEITENINSYNNSEFLPSESPSTTKDATSIEPQHPQDSLISDEVSANPPLSSHNSFDSFSQQMPFHSRLWSGISNLWRNLVLFLGGYNE